MKTSADWPPLTAHLPSMIVMGTPEMPFARAASAIFFTSASNSSVFKNATAWEMGKIGT